MTKASYLVSCIIFFTLILTANLYSQNPDNLQLLFKKAQSRRELQAFENAIYAYKAVLIQFEKISKDSNASMDSIYKAVPYATAATYHLGIVTPKYILGNFNKLYKSLNLYGETEKWINEINTRLADLKVENGLSLSTTYLSLLTLAKAYNKISWANTSFNGISWKRYYVCRPQEAATMVENAIKEIKNIFENLEIKEFNNIEEILTKYVSSLKEDSIEFNGLALMTSSHHKDQITKTLIKQLKYAHTTVELYERELMPVFKKSFYLHTFEDYLKESSLAKEISQAFEKLIESSGIKEL